jgi:ABC-type lipoprotein export system ATPase subunit
MYPLLKIEGLRKTYRSGSEDLVIIDHFDLEVQAGEMLALVGRSGSGKTTLLNLIAGLDRADAGAIFFEGKDLCQQDDHDWISWRQQHLGFVFQFNQLLHEFTALENVMLPGLLRDGDRGALKKKAQELLDRLGIGPRAHHFPSQLSGGEQQRTAIARALFNDPRLVLADEPTGSLDLESGQQVFDLLVGLQKDLGFSCLVVTHNPGLADLCDRIRAIDQMRS